MFPGRGNTSTGPTLGRNKSVVKQCDVVVVGGGPAGSTCAWKLRQAGLDVIVLDRAAFPRDKLCAGWVTPQVIEDLQLDIDSYPHSFMTFDRLHFHWKKLGLAKKTVQHSIRRVEFDDFLLQRSGALVYEHNVRRIEQKNGRYIIDDEYQCQYLVGAGGTACPVYRQLFHDANPRAKNLQIATLELEFDYHWKDDVCHLWFYDDGLPGYAWYVPKANGYLNIGLGGRAEKMKANGAHLKKFWSDFVHKLHDKQLVTGTEIKPGGYSYYLRGNVDTVRIDNAIIVGDSVGLASIDMGEGIGPAIKSAIQAAEAISDGREYTLRTLQRFTILPEFCSR